MAEEVVIEEYKTEWLQEFEDEKTKISQTLQGKAAYIEHIGSTSIVGLPSKPILDIAVGALLFRNYLRCHPEKVVEYAQLKKHLASLYLKDRSTYTQQKAPFIQSVIELAKKLTRN